MGRTHHRESPRDASPGIKGGDGPFFITLFAFRRFHERIAPQLKFGHAKMECATIARAAKKTGEKTPAGDDVFVASSGEPIRFIVKNDPIHGPVCVTILPPYRNRFKPENEP